MAPTPDQYKVALQALRDDAKTWTSCAGDLSAAKGTADSLDLSALHFTYIADKLGVTQIYTDFQNKMVRLLGEGETTCNNVAGALEKSAQTYEAEETAGVHKFNKVW